MKLDIFLYYFYYRKYTQMKILPIKRKFKRYFRCQIYRFKDDTYKDLNQRYSIRSLKTAILLMGCEIYVNITNFLQRINCYRS